MNIDQFSVCAAQAGNAVNSSNCDYGNPGTLRSSLGLQK